MSKNEIYHQMPTPPLTGIGPTGVDTFPINPDTSPGNISRIRSIYIDLPTGVTLNINLSILGSGQDDIVSYGNEAGSIIFRDGIVFAQPISINVTGTSGTPYTVRIVTETETGAAGVSVQQAGFPSLLGIGIAIGLLYSAYKASKSKKPEFITPS